MTSTTTASFTSPANPFLATNPYQGEETLLMYQVSNWLDRTLAAGKYPVGSFAHTGRLSDIYHVEVEGVTKEGFAQVVWSKNSKQAKHRFVYQLTLAQREGLAKNELRTLNQDIKSCWFMLPVGVKVPISTTFNGAVIVKMTTVSSTCLTYASWSADGRCFGSTTVHFARAVHATKPKPRAKPQPAVAPKKGGNEKKPRFKKGQKQK